MPWRNAVTVETLKNTKRKFTRKREIFLYEIYNYHISICLKAELARY